MSRRSSAWLRLVHVLALFGSLGGVAGSTAVPAAAADLPPPRLSRASGTLAVSLAPEILHDAAVARHLSSGLTTGFVVRLTARDATRRKAEGLGRIEIRFELWDEVYLARELDGERSRAGEVRLADREALERWWSALELELDTVRALDPASPWRLEVELDVLPFSAAEARDAERWFSDSIAARRSSADAVNEAAGDESSRLGNVLDLVMATSLERPPILRHSWNLTAAVPR